MVNFLHDLYFSLHRLSAVRLQQLELLVDFDCYLLVEQLVEAHSDNCIGTLPNPLSDDVVIDILNRASISAELVLLPIFYSWVSRSVIIFFNLVSQVCIIVGVRRIFFVISKIWPLSSSSYESASLSRLQLSNLRLVKPCLSEVLHGVPHGIVSLTSLSSSILVDIVHFTPWSSVTSNGLCSRVLIRILSLLRDLPANWIGSGGRSLIQLNVVKFYLPDICTC